MIKNEKGRSMVEMLGVLAIIGVLSVGGIAGYSKAMMQFKINKTINQIMYTAAEIRTLFAGQPYCDEKGNNYWDNQHISSITSNIFKCDDDRWHNCYNEWGETVYIYSECVRSRYEQFGYYNKSELFRIYTNIPYEACVKFYSTDWGTRATTGVFAINMDDSCSVYEFGCAYQSDYKEMHETEASTWAKDVAQEMGIPAEYTIPMSVADAVQFCKQYEGDDFVGFAIFFE